MSREGARLWPPIALFAEHGASYSLQRFRAHAVTSADVNADAKKSQGRHIRLPHLTSRGQICPEEACVTDVQFPPVTQRRT